MSASAAADTACKRKPIVEFLRLPEDGGAAYLAGLRCLKCGACYLDGGKRIACSKCAATGALESIRLSDRGKLWVYSIVHQSVPGVKTPYIAAIVDLPEGVSVRCNLIDLEPDPEKIQFDLPVEMTTSVVGKDREGNEVVAFFFRPAAR